MIINNTINDYLNNFQTNPLCMELYYEKYRDYFSQADLDFDMLIKKIPHTITNLKADTANILKLNTKLVHIIFSVRLDFLKTFNIYLTPNIYFLIGSYDNKAIIKVHNTPSIYFFVESLSEDIEALYAAIRYYFAQLYIYSTSSHSLTSNYHSLDKSSVLNVLEQLQNKEEFGI